MNIEFTTSKSTSEFQPRACDCSFCRKHGAAYISDPKGKLSIIQRNAGALHEYRQGSNTARFLLCKDCGVLVGVALDHESGTYAAVNAGCLDDVTELGESLSASPQRLSPEEKVSRWLALWVPDVVFTTVPQ
ncbi:GFA family protein [Dyella psychrodurans]|uniref:GFA family protein n=1 Tax=Dyella psychrodurans TaxID=1927960 RepID=UPI001F46F89D|nr:GFA family protein [Dyella psychrodurans]